MHPWMDWMDWMDLRLERPEPHSMLGLISDRSSSYPETMDQHWLISGVTLDWLDLQRGSSPSRIPANRLRSFILDTL